MYACVPGEPVAKGRPRFSTFSGKPRPVVIKSGPRKGQVRMSTTRVQAPTPKATKDWEKLAAHYFAESWRAIRGRKRGHVFVCYPDLARGGLFESSNYP